MATGDAFTQRQRESIVRAVRQAETATGLHCSVYVGPLDAGAPRVQALQLHAALGAAADRTVLVAIDPTHQVIELVTGAEAGLAMGPRACSLVALAVTTQAALGDLAGGIVSGLRAIAEHARRPETMHLG